MRLSKTKGHFFVWFANANKSVILSASVITGKIEPLVQRDIFLVPLTEENETIFYQYELYML